MPHGRPHGATNVRAVVSGVAVLTAIALLWLGGVAASAGPELPTAEQAPSAGSAYCGPGGILTHDDGSTGWVRCSATSGGRGSIRAKAVCSDGSLAYGPWWPVNYGVPSQADCGSASVDRLSADLF
jgi:hypothetical protein